jgi:hypothetical protein
MQTQAKRKKRRPKPVTLAEVDEFMASPVAGHYYSFSESNVKRRLIRMMFFLRAEVDRLQRQIDVPADDSLQWRNRVSRR